METYWKSLATPFSAPSTKPARRIAQPMRAWGSVQNSPTTHATSSSTNHTLTLTSLVGEYVHLVVQVTRDLHPVVYDRWTLPEPQFDLGVADLTLDQIKAFMRRSGGGVDLTQRRLTRPADWHRALSSSLLSLSELLRVSLLLYPSPPTKSHKQIDFTSRGQNSPRSGILLPNCKKREPPWPPARRQLFRRRCLADSLSRCPHSNPSAHRLWIFLC